MGTEIERKFLVAGDGWRTQVSSRRFIRQGYIALGPPTAIRVRIVGQTANLNIKKATHDIERTEFEYPIPLTDALEMIEHLCVGSPIEKTRHEVPDGERVWEIDVFHGLNHGLVVAELEIPTRTAAFELPDWLGPEISDDPRYLNAYLAVTPYTLWK